MTIELPARPSVPGPVALGLLRRSQPTDDTGRLALLRALISEGELDEAEELLAGLAELSVPVPLVAAVVRLNATTGFGERSVDALVAAARPVSEREVLELRLGRVRRLLAIDEPESAASSLDEIATDFPHSDLVAELSTLVNLPGDPDRHRAICERAVDAGDHSTRLASAAVLGALASGDLDASGLGEVVGATSWSSTIGAVLRSDATGLLDRVAMELSSHPGRTFRRPDRASRATWRVDHLLPAPTAAVGELGDAILQASQEAVAVVSSANETIGSDIVPGFEMPAGVHPLRLDGWSVTVRGDGYETWHTHPAAVLSGVMYVAVPEWGSEGDCAGSIAFGAPAVRVGGDDDVIAELHRPAAGDIRLFPSFLHHRTFPSGVDEDRVCVAFDLVPVR